MKKYLVKEIKVATLDNKTFCGETHIFYKGKGDEVVGYEGTDDFWTWYRISDFKSIPKWLIEEYAYSRRCDAKRAYSYKNPENTKYWKSFSEIVEVEI